MAMPRVRMATTTITRDTSQASGMVFFWCSPKSTPDRPTSRKVEAVRGETGEADGHLTQDSGAADIYTGDAEALGGLSQHGEYAVVEGVGIKEQGGGHTDDADDERGRTCPSYGG